MDGTDLCRDSTITRIERYRIYEEYSTRGPHSSAVNNCLGARISIRHAASKTDYLMEVRAFNDGIGFRFTLTAMDEGLRDEATTFKIPPAAPCGFMIFEGHYEGVHRRKEISAVREGEWAAPPFDREIAESSWIRRDHRSGID